MIVAIAGIVIVLLVVAVISIAMANVGHDGMSFMFLGILSGFALAICLGIGYLIVT